MIRLLLVDDQTLIRQGLRSLLDAMPDLDVVGEAENGAVALEQVEALSPDVVMMDVRMPVMDGVIATQQIQQKFPDTKVLVLTTFDDDAYIRPAMENGAIGYLLKDTPAAELVDAIRAAHKGYTQMGPGLLKKALSSSPTVPSTSSMASSSTSIKTSFSNTQIAALATLTEREKEVLNLIAQGANNREIADALYISEKTVKNHITNILGRLGVRDRTQAAILAHTNPGLLSQS
ncbi:MAG: response regulator transcription factor [Cyanobacteria bacterium P01_F01_bin.150]